MLLSLQPAWAYRGFIRSTIFNELRIRFAGSRLGGLWMILHPLLEVAIYATVLSALMSTRFSGIDSRFSYTIYLTSGIVCWTLFTDIVNRSLTVFVANAHLLKKLAFPVSCLPFMVGGAALLQNGLLLSAVLLMLALMDHFPGFLLLMVPVFMLVTVLLGIGLGFVLGILNVFIRDISQVVPVVLQLSFWLTPVVYPLDAIPSHFHWLFNFNPMFHVVQAYQGVLVFHRMPQWTGLAVVLVLSVALLALAATLYRRAKSELVDML